MTRPAPRRRAGLTAALLLAAFLAVAPGGDTATYIVRATSSEVAETSVLRVGGVVQGHLPLIDGVVATISAVQAGTLAHDRTVSVDEDVPYTMASSRFTSGSSARYADSAVATTMHRAGNTGTGVGVAVLDTGIAAHKDLSGRIVGHVNVSTEAGASDGYGHGTFMAGIIAGNGQSAGGHTVGVAPGAHLLNVKVADADGTTSLSRILYGLQVIDASAERFSIRVVNLSLTGPATPDEIDPLEDAVARLWANGLVVVVSSGNGPAPGAGGEVGSPASQPHVIAVGATDDAATTDRADDRLAEFSTYGSGDLDTSRPDIVAPGRNIISLRVAGSTLDRLYPEATEGANYFRGSGTSMSAAVISGAAALLIADDPSLSPDEVKGRLMAGATAIATSTSAGAGNADVFSARSHTAVANAHLPSLQPQASTYPDDGAWQTDSSGSQHWTGNSWNGSSWNGSSWNGSSWNGNSWNGNIWEGYTWE